MEAVAASEPASPGSVRVIPLGGSGEIGKNMYVVENADDGRMVVIDCGVTFPTHDQLGVDLVLPDFEYVEQRAALLEAVILTHGHEDHIGALPYLLRAIGPIPVYGPRFALGLVRSKLEEHRLRDIELIEVEYGRRRPIGPFEAEFVPLTHSIPDCAAVALHTPAGTVVHTGDFKFDHIPIGGRPTDIPALARLGDAGVALLLADSTGSENPGAVRAERTVGDEFARVFAIAPGRVIVTTFASHMHRVQQVLDAAYRDGRVVCLIGRSLMRNTGIARNLGHLSPPDVLVRPRELEAHPPDEQVVLCTGSQGEPLAALSRMARGEHQHIRVGPGDTVVYSSRTVPGNELAVNEIVNRLVRIGARIITWESVPGIHVSGHGSAPDLLLMLQLLRPAVFAPIHGEPRHQRAHADLAESLGIDATRTFILDNGDVLELAPEGAGARVAGRVPAGLTYVDNMGLADVAESVLRDRRHLAEDGLVLVVATINGREGTLIGEIDVITRGFGAGDDDRLIEETRLEVERSISASAEQRVVEVGILQHQLHDAVAALLKKRTQQRPMVLPVIVEV